MRLPSPCLGLRSRVPLAAAAACLFQEKHLDGPSFVRGSRGGSRARLVVRITILIFSEIVAGRLHVARYSFQ